MSNTNIDTPNVTNDDQLQKCSKEEILFLMEILEENANSIHQKMIKKNNLNEEIESLYNKAMYIKETISIPDLTEKDIKKVKKIQKNMNEKIKENSILSKEINDLIEFGNELSNDTLKLILLNNFDDETFETKIGE